MIGRGVDSVPSADRCYAWTQTLSADRFMGCLLFISSLESSA